MKLTSLLILILISMGFSYQSGTHHCDKVIFYNPANCVNCNLYIHAFLHQSRYADSICIVLPMLRQIELNALKKDLLSISDSLNILTDQAFYNEIADQNSEKDKLLTTEFLQLHWDGKGKIIAVDTLEWDIRSDKLVPRQKKDP